MMSVYKNDKGEYSVVPVAAGEGVDLVKWSPLDSDQVVRELGDLKAQLEYARAEVVARNERINSLERDRARIEEYVSEAAKEGNEELNIKEFAEEFGFSLEVTREFTMTIEIQGTATFPIGEEPDLSSDADVTVDVSSYYSNAEFEVDDTSVYSCDWQ